MTIPLVLMKIDTVAESVRGIAQSPKDVSRYEGAISQVSYLRLLIDVELSKRELAEAAQ